MNKILNILLKTVAFSAMVFVMSGCEEVIDVDLKEANPSLVVEAQITDSIAPFEIHLTTTKDFFSGKAAPAVTTADVVIADDAGNSDVLHHIGNGFYRTDSLKKGVVGRRYSLNINYNSKSYTASSVLAGGFSIDSVKYAFVKGSPIQPKGYYLTVYGKDAPEKGNFFLIRAFRNDSMQTEPVKYLSNGDEFFDAGKPVQVSLPYKYNQGDIARVEFYSITKEYSEYLFNLNNQLNIGGGPFDPQPANLPSNISGGAFGFFVAAGISKATVTIR